jgi:UDP-N-acetylmuramate: L-alanyl-gamma-D-glutamyl-meso-diaminopimelate ligase
MELRGVVNNISVYDDFAHHPTAIATTLQGLRDKVGAAQRIIAVVELRSNTMRRGIFKDQLAASLQLADFAIVCHPQQSTAGLSDALIASLICEHNRICASADEVLDTLLNRVQPGDHIVIMSNGGFADIHRRLLSALGTSPPL